MEKIKKIHILYIAGIVLSLGVGALAWWRAASVSAATAPLPVPEELQPLMETAAPPDPFSDELAPVLAAVPPRYRAVLLRQHGRGEVSEETMYFLARAWALSRDNMTGDDAEMELFLSRLERSIPESVPLDSLHTPEFESEKDERLNALHAMSRALLSEAPYSEAVRQRIHDQALRHLPYKLWKEYSARLLVLLHEQGALTEEEVALMEEAINDPYLNAGPGFWGRFEASRDKFQAEGR